MAKTIGGDDRARSAGLADPMRAVEALLPLVEAEAEAAERQYHLSDRVVDALRKSGLYAMLLPKALGGGELPFIDAMEVVARLAWADASTGWCTMVNGVMSASLGAFVADEGARAVYGGGPDVTVSGNGVPRGYARRVPGGYMIRGRWAYGSGIYHAEWIHSGCFLMDGDKPAVNADGTPVIVLTHHPKASIELKNNWDVLGLRATGSFDYTLKEPELFVPDSMCFPFDGAVLQRGGAALWNRARWLHHLGPYLLGARRRPARARRARTARTRTQRRLRQAVR